MIAFLKFIALIAIMFLVLCMGGLYKAFEKLPANSDNEQGWIGVAMIVELIAIIALAVFIVR